MSGGAIAKLFHRVVLASGLAILAAAPVQAADYPVRQIRIIVGFAPGGAVDILARIIAGKMGERYNQQAFVENRPGANANLAADTVARAAPDGYTLLMITSSHVISAALKQKVNFDPIKSFAPIAKVAVVPNVILVNPTLNVTTLPDFIKLLKANPPGKFNFASTGVGGATHLAGESFKLAAGVDLTHIPYQGAGPALTALMAGDVHAYFGSVSGAQAYVTSGQMRALAIPSQTRSSAMPNVPTTVEAGLPDYQYDTWYGMLAPAGTPAEITEKLAVEFKEIMALPDVKPRLEALGAEISVQGPATFGAFMSDEIARLSVVAKKAGLDSH